MRAVVSQGLNCVCCGFIGNKLCEDGKKYGVENTCTSGSTLSRAALSFAKARSLIEKERGNLLKAFGTQVLIPFWFYYPPTVTYRNRGLCSMYN